MLHNDGQTNVGLQGWLLRDTSEKTYPLSGTILAGARQEVHMATFKMPLNNNGDTIELLDANGDVVHSVTYTRSDVREGEYIEFGQ